MAIKEVKDTVDVSLEDSSVAVSIVAGHAARSTTPTYIEK